MPERHVPDRGRLCRAHTKAQNPYGSAVRQCLQVGTPAGPGRRLFRPTANSWRRWELSSSPGAGGELTANVYPSGSDAGRLDDLYVIDQVGGVALTPDTAPGAKAYRCVTDPVELTAHQKGQP